MTDPFPELDTSCIGIAAAKLMDEVAEDHPEATIEAALVAVDVSFTDEDGDDATSVLWKFVKGSGEPLSAAHAHGIASLMDAVLQP